jgi:rod shape-determining protein MreD
MIKFEKISLVGTIIKYFPILLLLASVLNEFDFNYMGFKYFSFNFPFILIFYWSLKKSGSLGYGLIFIAGLFNDVVVGLPMGVSSLTYLLICGFAAYLRNITLRPNLIKDWFFFLFTISLLNSLNYILLTLFFSFKISYEESLFNLFFTFVFYIIFAYIFDIYQKIIMGKLND